MAADLVLTPSLLSLIRSHPTLPADTWYFITAVALSTLNRPEEVGYVLQAAIEGKEPQEQIRITRRIREALIKSVGVSGLPRVINTLLSLKTTTPPALLDPASHPSPLQHDMTATPAAEIHARGQAFFAAVYGPNSAKLMRVMNGSGTPDLGAAGRLMYSYLLSNTTVLSAPEAMFVTTAGMIVTDVNSALLNHMRGAVRQGAAREEVDAVREVVVWICEGAGMRRFAGRALGWRGDVAKL